MSEIVNIQLQTSSILRVPVQSYANDFTFIVNGESIPTSRLISEILSPKISKIHSNDPTIDHFVINTTEQGDFRQILKLVNFEEKRITSDQVPFFIEVLELLGNESLSIGIENKTEITTENVIAQLLIHEKHPNFYRQLISEEIEFISSHFYELCEAQKEGLKKLEINTLYSIIDNPKLQLKTEKQLLTFINELYSNNSEHSILYETVIFENVSPTSMKEFISIFNLDDMTTKTWNQLSSRLCFEINKSGKNKDELKRYKRKIFQVKEQINEIVVN